MGGYEFDFRFLEPFAPAFFRGALIALNISLWSFVWGMAAGLLYGVALHRLKGSEIFLLINDAIRALPPLVLIFFIYFFPFNQFGVPPISPVATVILALGLAQAAYTADLTYFALHNVSPHLIEGGRAMGLREVDIWRYLVLPDIGRQMLPAQMAFLIGIMRLSSLGAVIGAQEVVYVARIAIAQNFRSIEAWLVVGAVYIALVTPFTVLARHLERSEWLKRRF